MTMDTHGGGYLSLLCLLSLLSLLFIREEGLSFVNLTTDGTALTLSLSTLVRCARPDDRSCCCPIEQYSTLYWSINSHFSILSSVSMYVSHIPLDTWTLPLGFIVAIPIMIHHHRYGYHARAK